MKSSVDLRVAQGTWVVLAATALLVGWQACRAVSVRYRALLQERAALAARVSQVQAMVQTVGGRDAWLTIQQQALDVLRKRVPPQAQLPLLLNAVADVFHASDVKLLELMQGNVEPVQRQGQPLLRDGVQLGQLPITVTAEGRYHALRAVLERLTDQTFPGVVGVRHVEMVRPAAGTPRLSATLQILLYVATAPTQSSSP